MKTHYEAPELFAIKFISQDIITASVLVTTRPTIPDNDPENDAEWD